MTYGRMDDLVRGPAGRVKPPCLTGSVVKVRPAVPADAEAWFAIRAQAGPGQSPMDSVAAAAASLAEMAALPPGVPGWRQFMIEDPDQHIIGDIGLRWPSPELPAELGFEMAAAARRRGLAAQAVGLIVDWAFEVAKFAMLCAVTQGGNAPAHRLLVRLGFAPQVGGQLATALAIQHGERLYVKRAPDA